MRAPPSSKPAISPDIPLPEAVKLPEKSTGYQRKAQTLLGYQQASYVTFDANNLPVARGG